LTWRYNLAIQIHRFNDKAGIYMDYKTLGSIIYKLGGRGIEEIKVVFIEIET
jgi:hypothetical protein